MGREKNVPVYPARYEKRATRVKRARAAKRRTTTHPAAPRLFWAAGFIIVFHHLQAWVNVIVDLLQQQQLAWGTNQSALSVCISPPYYPGPLWWGASWPSRSSDRKCNFKRWAPHISYVTYMGKKKRKTHLTTPSPASCIKVDNSLLFSISLCHLTSQLAVPKRKPNMQPPLVSKLELEFLLQELCQAWVHLHLWFWGILPSRNPLKKLQQMFPTTQLAHLQGSAVAQLALHQVSSLPWTIINHPW